MEEKHFSYYFYKNKTPSYQRLILYGYKRVKYAFCWHRNSSHFFPSPAPRIIKGRKKRYLARCVTSLLQNVLDSQKMFLTDGVKEKGRDCWDLVGLVA